MVKALLLGLFAVMMCGIACAAPAPQPARKTPPPLTSPHPHPPPLEEDPAVRNERSTNLSVAGSSRKIQMFIKNRHLQLLPDGTVNGTTDYSSPYTILQRTTVGIGKMRIQGVATCQYLCMDSCGLLYGSREFGEECIFNETIEQHYYNTYSSTKYSNVNRTLYLALNRRGQPRKVQVRAQQQLGRYSSYTRVLTRTVEPDQVDSLYHVRHHAHSCTERLAAVVSDSHHPAAESPRCRKRKKKRKKKRKCLEGEIDPECHHKRHEQSQHLSSLNPSPHTPQVTPQPVHNNLKKTRKQFKKCDPETSDRDRNNRDECQRDEVTAKKNQKTVVNDKVLSVSKKKNKKNKKSARKRGQATSTEVAAMTTSITATTILADEDYLESTTHWEWEDSTSVPDPPMAVSGHVDIFPAQVTLPPD